MAISKVGVIGAGIMGEALISALIRSGIAASSITIVEKRNERSDEIVGKYGVKTGSVRECDALLLVVKPQDLETTCESLKGDMKDGALVVSFLAGKKSLRIEELLSGVRVVRVMPNTPLTLGSGMSAISGGKSASESDIAWVDGFLKSSGKTIVVGEEMQDAVTALSGSGPAYFFMMVEAMAEAGVKLGLSKEDALVAAKETLIGAAAMVEKSGKEPSTLRENVTSPNGTTFAALTKFKDEGFAESVYRAMEAARDRSIELST